MLHSLQPESLVGKLRVQTVAIELVAITGGNGFQDKACLDNYCHETACVGHRCHGTVSMDTNVMTLGTIAMEMVVMKMVCMTTIAIEIGNPFPNLNPTLS